MYLICFFFLFFQHNNTNKYYTYKGTPTPGDAPVRLLRQCRTRIIGANETGFIVPTHRQRMSRVSLHLNIERYSHTNDSKETNKHPQVIKKDQKSRE